MTRKLTFLILALFALIAGPGAKAWGQNPTHTWDLTSASTDWTAEGNETYFSQPYGYKKANGTLTNANVADFTTYATEGKTITSIKVGFKGLRNGNTVSKITISLVDADGNILTSGDELELTNASSASNTAYVYSTFTTGFTGATGFMMKVTTFGKNVLINGASYEIVYTEAGAPELQSIAVSGTPSKTTYEAGEEFAPAGLVVTGTYDDASTAEITSGITWTVTPSPLTAGTTSVSVIATVSGITSPAYTVNGLTVTEHVQTYANTYTSNVTLSTEGGTSASTAKVIWKNVEYDAIKCGTGSVAGKCIVTIPANTQTLHFHAAGWNGETVKLNGTFDLVADGGVSGNSPFTLQNDPETSDYFTLNPQGATSITFTATTGKRFVLFGVNAEEGPVATLESISIKTVPDKVNYLEGENFDPTGLVITKHFVEEGADDEDLAYSETTASQFSFSPTLTAALAATDTQVEITVGGKSVNQAITVTEAPKYTVSYHTNGVVSSEDVFAGENQLTAPANVPNGYTYVGWAEAPIESVAQTATYFSSYNVTEDVDLYAVFAIATKGGNSYRLSSTAPVAGDNVIVAGKKDGKYYALSTELSATELTIANGVVTNYEGCVWSASYDDYNETYGIVLNNGTNPLHMNSSALKVASGNTNGTFEFPVSGDGFKIYGNQNTRWMTFNGTTFGVTSEEASASTLYFFMPDSFSNFCTTVTALSGNLAEATTVAGNAYYISAAANVPANETATINGVLGNADASLLIIEDGAQLFQNSSNVMATFQKNITGYTGDNDNYYLIANPTANAVGEEDEYDALDGCTTFDLYTFDPTAELEWVNIGQTAQKVTFDRNVGYLYANAQDMTLHFRGYLLPTNGTTDINLVYYTGGEAGREFLGFNLIGNPYTCNAYVNGYNFYTMADGEFVINEGSATVAPCEGFFVEATEANQSVTVSTAAPVTAPNALSLNVSQNRGNVIDRAIVRFDGANDLHKFMMNPAHTNLSIAKGGETFAAISTEAEGELPVNFKAEKNGTYTITVNTKNVDAEYLHLIDNMTGMDVNLLSTPSYTFEAKTSDYASRFKLVFGVNNTASESSDSNFAFMSDGNLVIDNIEGEATLQIVDELGRVISTETVSGSYNKALNLKAGLYILNLNGMTQKIVVE